MLTFDDSLKKRVFLLNISNYQQWQQKLIKLFEFLDATNHIELDKKPDDIDENEWDNDDLAVKNFLIDIIEDENIKRLVTDIKTSYEIWIKLKKICEEKSKFDLLLMLDNFKIKSNLTESIKQFEQLLEDTKIFINEESNYRSIKLLNSLPSYYSEIRSKYLHNDDNLDYEQIKNELLDYEKEVISKMNLSNESLKEEKDNTKEQDQNDNNIQQQQQQKKEQYNEPQKQQLDFNENHCKEKLLIIDSSKSTTIINQQNEKIQDIRFRNQDEVNAEISERKYANSQDYNVYDRKDRKRYDSQEYRSTDHNGSSKTIRSYEKDKQLNKFDNERNSRSINDRKSYDERIDSNEGYVNLSLFRLLQQQNTLEECEKLLKDHMIKPGGKSIEA